jgi:hypothetical protein
MKGHITGSLGGGASVKHSEGTSKWKFNFQMQTAIEVNADFTANHRVTLQTDSDKGKIEGSSDSESSQDAAKSKCSSDNSKGDSERETGMETDIE